MYSKLYNFLSWLSDIVLLNILWFFCSIPLITLYPSTASLLYCFKKRLNGNETNVFRDFFEGFRLYFSKSLLAEILVIVSIFVFYIDLIFLTNIFSLPEVIILALLFIFCFFVLTFNIFFFPTLMDHMERSLWMIIKNTYYSAFAEPLILIKSLGIFLILIILINFAPILIFLGGVSLAGYFWAYVFSSDRNKRNLEKNAFSKFTH